MSSLLESETDELLRLFQRACSPFPHADCQVLRRETGVSASLAADLDDYFSEVAGYSSWGRRLLKWPSEKVNEVRLRLASSFFDKHPEYKHLEPLITPENVPGLFAQMQLHDEMRARLLRVLALLKADES